MSSFSPSLLAAGELDLSRKFTAALAPLLNLPRSHARHLLAQPLSLFEGPLATETYLSASCHRGHPQRRRAPLRSRLTSPEHPTLSHLAQLHRNRFLVLTVALTLPLPVRRARRIASRAAVATMADGKLTAQSPDLTGACRCPLCR
jgi:hypothetical protein